MPCHPLPSAQAGIQGEYQAPGPCPPQASHSWCLGWSWPRPAPTLNPACLPVTAWSTVLSPKAKASCA